MIDTTKLLPRLKESTLSKESMKNLVEIKKDVVKLDNLLKERLVLSKVREGILRQQEENQRRLERESSLEGRNRKDKDSDYKVDLNSKKPKPGSGGLVGAIITSVLRNFSGIAFAKIGSLLKVGKLLKVLLAPKALVIVGTLTLLSKVLTSSSKIGDNVKEKDLNAIKGDKVSKAFKKFDDDLRFFAGALVAAGITSATGRFVRGRKLRNQEISSLKGRLTAMGNRQRASAEAKAEADAKADIESDINKERRRREAKKRTKIMKRDAEIVETASKQSRVVRKIKKEVGGQIVPVATKDPFAGTKGMTSIMKRGTFLVDRDNFDVSEITRAGASRNTIAKTNIRLSGLELKDAAGNIEEVFEAAKTPALKRNIEKRLGMKIPKEVFDNSFDMFELKSNLGLKARRDAGIDALLDAINMEDTQGFTLRQQADQAKLLDRILGGGGRDNKFAQMTERSRRRALDDPLSKVRTGERGTDVVSKGRVGSRQFLRPDGTSTDDAFRATMKKIDPKSALKQTTKKTPLKALRGIIRKKVDLIPFIGDFVGLLLDIFVFGEPPGRAAFMAVGGALGGFLGGMLGSIGGPPGAIILGILGGIGGDILGGLAYDLLFRRDSQNPLDRIPKATIKQGIKQGLFSGGFASLGNYILGEQGKEFVLDADTTAALEDNYPGFLSALNKADYDGALEVLQGQAFYEMGTGTEQLIPIPIPSPSPSDPDRRVNTITIKKSSSNVYFQHYRR